MRGGGTWGQSGLGMLPDGVRVAENRSGRDVLRWTTAENRQAEKYAGKRCCSHHQKNESCE